MWAGIHPKHESTDHDAAKISGYFACPEQPSLKLPLSRVKDGICDCCDGADEKESTNFQCPDVCDMVMAEERAARAKATSNFAFGSKRRLESVAQFQKWHDEKTRDLKRLRDVDLVKTHAELEEVENDLMVAKVALAKNWVKVVKEDVLGADSPLLEVVGNDSMSVNDLSSFILSLCALSAELSSGNVVMDRCLALERASLDVGILWDDDYVDEGDTLPSFEYLDSESESALADYAGMLIKRLDGKDASRSSSRKKKNSSNNKHKKRDPPPVEYDSEDDPYGDDFQDEPNYNYDPDDEYHEWSEEEDGESEVEGEDGVTSEEEPQLTPNEVLVKSLLDSVPIDRDLFKEQSKLLLKFTLGAPEDETDDENENELKDSASSIDSSSVDPMAMQMTKSAISKRISNISRGESSAKSAASFVASLMESSTQALNDLQKLAIMTVYHSNIAAGDISELIYLTSSYLRSMEASSESSGDGSCSPSWSLMCPPRTVILPSGDKSYPPSFVLEAARNRCEQRENSIGICTTVQEVGEVQFPATVSDGYYNYYEPQSRDGGSKKEEQEDRIAPYFSSIHSLHGKTPSHIVNLEKQRDSFDRKKRSLTKSVEDLENEIGDDSDDNSKYGVDGELYFLRNICHKLESGKYEYEVCVFGKATQRDIGQSSGGTHLGSWETVDVDEHGRRTFKWGKGTKCWNGPVRSAEVAVTCGAETRVLTADEPETCRYVFTMESPIGCDERFRLKHSL